MLEFRRLRMPRLYDMTWQKPAPLVERRLRREVRERVDLDGSVVRPLDLAEVRRAVDDLVDEGVESIAVSLIHAYANPAHERAIGELLEREYPELWVSLSHRVLPIIREYERTSTTVLNAYVQPTVASYLRASGASSTAPGRRPAADHAEQYVTQPRRAAATAFNVLLTVNVAQVMPEPGICLMLFAGLGLVWFTARRRVVPQAA